MALLVLRRLQNVGKTNRLRNLCTTQSSSYDIIITGGGMVGTTLACTLGKNSKLCDKRILLLEANKPKEWVKNATYEKRVSSLNPSTHKLMSDIGAWSIIAENRFGIVKKLQVWDGLSDALITFSNENFDDIVAYIVENELLLHAVSHHLKDLPNVDVVYGSKVKSYDLVDFHSNKSHINMEDGSSYSCELLVGCDGANSQVRQSMAVQYVSWNYNQMGLVGTLNLSQEDADNVIAWQRFLPTGPIALLPLNKSQSSLVWSTTPQNAKELLAMDESTFIQALNDALFKKSPESTIVNGVTQNFDKLLRFLRCPNSSGSRQLPPKIISCDPNSRAIFPLGFGHATNYISKGVVLVGDAAHRVHPLAGQGVNLGFGDVVCLNRVLGEAVYSGSKISDINNLKRYETERQRHNIPTMLAVDGLHRIYATDFQPLVLLRSIGLQTTHALNPLKRAIIQIAAA